MTRINILFIRVIAWFLLKCFLLKCFLLKCFLLKCFLLKCFLLKLYPVSPKMLLDDYILAVDGTYVQLLKSTYQDGYILNKNNNSTTCLITCIF